MHVQGGFRPAMMPGHRMHACGWPAHSPHAAGAVLTCMRHVAPVRPRKLLLQAAHWYSGATGGSTAGGTAGGTGRYSSSSVGGRMGQPHGALESASTGVARHSWKRLSGRRGVGLGAKAADASRRPRVGCNAKDDRTAEGGGTGSGGSRDGGTEDSAAATAPGAAAGLQGQGQGEGAPVYLGYVFLDNGEVLEMPRRRTELWPSFDLTWQQCLEVQLKALQHNNKPYPDYGIEILYRFADFSPWERALYFGRSLDLGQFERFRRVMHSPPYDALLNYESVQLSSCLQLSATRWRQRVQVRPLDERAIHTFDFTLVQRVGGRYDGYWFCESVIHQPEQE